LGNQYLLFAYKEIVIIEFEGDKGIEMVNVGGGGHGSGRKVRGRRRR